MAKRSTSQKPSPETREEARRIARSTQRPGQTKEQTKLITQGIEKGIDAYKRQQKAKARDLDRRLKTAKTERPSQAPAVEVRETVRYKRDWRPWALLMLSWAGFAAYALHRPIGG